MLAKPLMWVSAFRTREWSGGYKLNVLVLFGAGIALCMVLYWKSRTRFLMQQAMVFLAAGLLLLPTLTAAAFTVVNPFLYPHPVDNFRKMLSHRVTSIEEQQAQFPDATIAMRDIRTRVRVIPRKNPEPCLAVEEHDRGQAPGHTRDCGACRARMACRRLVA